MRKIYYKMCAIEEFFCGGALFFIVVLVFISAILRLAGMPIQWVMDISQLLFAWIAFTGMDIALRKSGVMGINLVTRNFPDKVQKIIKVIINLVIIMFLISLVYFGLILAIEGKSRTYQTLGISYSWATLSLPVCSIMMVLTILRDVVLTITEHKTGKEG